jgi:hypothetical protein
MLGSAAMIRSLYDKLAKEAAKSLGSQATTGLLAEVAAASLGFLRQRGCINLESKVASKTYFAFKSGDVLSRAVHSDLFDLDFTLNATTIFSDGSFHTKLDNRLLSFLYTFAISYCCSAELENKGDKKTPSIWFEILVGNILARKLGVEPQTRIDVKTLDEPASLPTDFIFDAGKGTTRLHVPVKLSTRERVIQAWAHQKILDGVFGDGVIKGILVVFSETKVDSKKLDVVEICLPDQWKLYQKYITRLCRVYYFDLLPEYATATIHVGDCATFRQI